MDEYKELSASKTYDAISGVDIVAAMYLPLIYKKGFIPKNNSKKFKVFGNLQTISISSTRSISPVRVLGRSNPIKILRGARCLPASEKVYIKDKGLVSIAEVETDDLVQSSPSTFNKVLATTKDGLKECFKITTKNNYSITASYDHPIMTTEGWKKPKDIKVKDKLLVTTKTPSSSDSLNINPDIIILIAYLLGDGHMGMHTHSTKGKFSYSIQLTISDSKLNTIGKETEEILKRLNIPFKDHRNQRYKCIERRIAVCYAGFGRTAPKKRIYNVLHYALLSLNLYRKRSETKKLPEVFLEKFSEEQISLFLNRLFSTDGWYGLGKRLEAVLSSTSLEMLNQVRFLLNKLGIPCLLQLSKKKGSIGGVINNRQIIAKQDLYKLIISDNYDLYNFINKVGIFSKEHEVTDEIKYKILSGINKRKLLIDTTQFNARIKNLCLTNKVSCQDVKFVHSRPTSIKKALQIKEEINHPEIDKEIDRLVQEVFDNPEEYLEVEVVSNESVGDLEVYDIEVEDRHEFICNYFKVHNTFAGTMVFASLSRDPFSDIYDVGLEESYLNAQSSIISDQLPPFSIVVVGANEQGASSIQAIHGITLVNMGTTYSIDDLYTEIVYSYVATDVTQLDTKSNSARSIEYNTKYVSAKTVSQAVEQDLNRFYENAPRGLTDEIINSGLNRS